MKSEMRPDQAEDEKLDAPANARDRYQARKRTALGPSDAAACSPSSDVRRSGAVTICRNGYVEKLESELKAYRRHHQTGECLKCLLNGWDPEESGPCPPYPECGRAFPKNVQGDGSPSQDSNEALK